MILQLSEPNSPIGRIVFSAIMQRGTILIGAPSSNSCPNSSAANPLFTSNSRTFSIVQHAKCFRRNSGGMSEDSLIVSESRFRSVSKSEFVTVQWCKPPTPGAKGSFEWTTEDCTVSKIDINDSPSRAHDLMAFITGFSREFSSALPPHLSLAAKRRDNVDDPHARPALPLHRCQPVVARVDP